MSEGHLRWPDIQRVVCALRDGLKSFCDCGLCFGHALGKLSAVKFHYRRLVFGLPLRVADCRWRIFVSHYRMKKR
jgi:hypothetical protein